MLARLLDWGRPTPIRDDLHPLIKDDVFHWQLSSADFAAATASTLLRADICRKTSVAEHIIQSCHDLGIIDPTNGHPCPDRVDRRMVNKLAKVSVRKQGELVLLLFFMEEEIVRWRLLSGQEEGLRRVLDAGGLSEAEKYDLEMNVKLVQAQKRALPSARDASGQMLPVRGDERLPGYEEALRSP